MPQPAFSRGQKWPSALLEFAVHHRGVPMRFLNPKTDFAFKKIFGSEESRDILLSFLNAILDLQHPYLIQEVEILDPYLAPKIQGMKDTYLDVRVKDEQGRSYIIEMQVLNVAGFEKRILYNACKAYANQIQKGEDYHSLTPVVAITITDFTMFDELPEVVNRFKLRAKANPEICQDDLELVFAELPKFRKAESQLDSVLDKWLYFLKTAPDLTAIPPVLAQEPAIAHAFGIANKAGLTAEELDDQERREIFIQDQRGALSLAEQRGRSAGKEEGFAEGREEGLALGRQEGEYRKALAIAANLLDVLDDATIAAKTGLDATAIAKLRRGSAELGF
jgi:predicted transposase/invertase (TIGR01784 family)